ncbi:TlpA family protein disulfide reductase [Nocardioides panacisoli]|uniref:TlpA family protein disulfide reductase n=1 Tax=Nocardioides panacisoli TaxID=627624 RepID=UPI001C630751|nr:TlpA disulfide reductase family protein [Nocardioides panacisoli]QYJ05417.1 TlpA family protein disulfide reductase [Nocardioides panacisoli]
MPTIAHRSLGFRAVVPVALAAVALAACGAPSGDSSANSQGYIEGEGVVEEVPESDRRPLPDFEGETLDGGHFDTRDQDGRVLVINVWGSWCPPCRKEAPELREAWQSSRGEDVQFVGIDVRDNDAAGLAFERKYDIDYPSITTDASGPAMLAVGTALPRNAIPSTLVVDTEGRIAARVIGGSTVTTFLTLIEDVLAESSPAS